jgi:hypothetical protein
MAGKPDKGFKVEYAKSGRAACKVCKLKINQEELRLGKMVPSPHFDGYIPLWVFGRTALHCLAPL